MGITSYLMIKVATAGAQMGITSSLMMKVAIAGAQMGIHQLSDDEGGYRGCSNGYLPAL